MIQRHRERYFWALRRIRNVLRYCRQDYSDIRRAKAQAATRQAAQHAGEARSRTSCAAGLLQKSGCPYVRKGFHLPALEICVNRLKDVGLNKRLENLDALHRKLITATDRPANFHVQLLNVHVDFPPFQQLARPVASGKSKTPGIKIQDTRMLRLMEALLHAGREIAGWRTLQICKPSGERLLFLLRTTPSINSVTTYAI
jgi:hypothetical protein